MSLSGAAPQPDLERLPEVVFPPLPYELWVAWLASQIAKSIVDQRHLPQRERNLNMLRWVWLQLTGQFSEPDDPERMRKDINLWAKQFRRQETR